MKEFIAIMIILSIILLFLVFALMIIGILIEMIKEIKQWTKRKLVNNMNDKQLLKTIQNDIKNLDKCIEMCIDEEGIDYLKTIQQNMREQEIKIVKKMAITKALKEKQHGQTTHYIINT